MASPDDWLASTPQQRRDLYRTAARLAKLVKVTRYELHCRALGQSLSDAFDENFRKGKISARNAAAYYQYLQTNYPEIAAALYIEAFTAKRFNDFLLHHRQFGLVQILPERDSI